MIGTRLILATDEAGTGVIDTVAAWLDNPTVAFLLLVLGIASVTVEVAHPGTVGTGVAGILLILAGLWSLSMQPSTPAGLGLIVLAAGLYIAELFVPTAGVAALVGSVALLVGGLLLVNDPAHGGVPAGVVLPATILLGVGAVFAGRLALRTRGAPSTLTGAGLLVGRDLTVARAERDGASGKAFIEGAWWNVRSIGAPLTPGAPARVVALDGLVLVVEPGDPDADRAPGQEPTEPAGQNPGPAPRPKESP
jgi:membrane-bound serine protease (ClpP class)